MKKVLVFLFSAVSLVSFSQQVSEKGTWIVGLGLEGGVYTNEITNNVFGTEENYTDSAAAYFIPLTVEYCFLNRLSAGASVRLGKYIDDEDYEDNDTRVFDLFVAYHFLKKQRNDLYAKIAFGSSNLIIENDLSDAEGEWSGGHFGIGLGYRHYFGEHIGVHVYIQNGAYNLKQKSLRVGSITVDPDDARWDMMLRGPEFGFGLVGKF